MAQNITITPREFRRNQSVTMTVRPVPGTGPDFSGVQSNGAAIIPSDDITNLQAIPQTNGDLRVDFSIVAEALFGIRTLAIVGPDHLVVASDFFRIVP